jgi:uncharacterized caspase-like protein
MVIIIIFCCNLCQNTVKFLCKGIDESIILFFLFPVFYPLNSYVQEGIMKNKPDCIRFFIAFLMIPLLFSCATTNLTKFPRTPPESGMRPGTDLNLCIDSFSFKGIVDYGSAARAESILIRYIQNKNFFNSILGSARNKSEGDAGTIRIKIVTNPSETHSDNWLITWPAVYPMPFYWPFQYKKGTVSITMQCEVFDNNGVFLSRLETSHSEDYKTKIYGFFDTRNAEAKLITCYENVFSNIAAQIVSDKKILALAEDSPSKKPVIRVTQKEKPKPQKKIITQKVVPSATEIPGNIEFGNYYALVIGINDYKYLTKLQTAVNDAQSISEVLTKNYKFNVKLLLNPNRTEIITSLSGLRRTMTSNDNLLIYYAGHGWLDMQAEEGYWLPVDATQNNEANWLSNATITSSIRAISAKHIMVIADSCYSGKLTRGLHIKRQTPDYLTRMAKKKTRVVLASGGLEPVEDIGGKNNHSVFADALLSTLSENRGVMDGTELFSKIKRPVMVNTDQVPEYGDIRKTGHDGGDFLFVYSPK